MSGLDVLAVMDVLIAQTFGDQSSQLSMRLGPEHPAMQARAAVAELIEASKAIEAHNAAATMAEWERFADALARVSGDSA